MLFEEDIEQKPNINTISIQSTSGSGSNGTDNYPDPEPEDDDSSIEPKRIRIDGAVSLAERRSDSVNSPNGHKNGDLEENESEFDPKIQEPDAEAIEAHPGNPSPVTEEGVQSLINFLEKEVNSLDNLLVTKELEWNALLRLKKLKELLLEQFRREDQISNLLQQSEGTEIKDLLKECILEQKYITKIDSDTKSSTNRIKNESAKVESEITENSGRRYNKIVQKEDLWPGETRNASKALQKLCERNSSSSFPPGAQDAQTKQGPKGPIVQVTSLIADYRAKRKHETANKKQKIGKISNPATATQISYSDVLVSLAKISSSAEGGKSASPEVSSTITPAPLLTPKINPRTSGKTNITLAKLLSASGSSNSTVTDRNELTKSGDDYKGRQVNSSTSDSISLSNLLASNSKQGRNESQKEGIPICQGCNTNQAQFVCAGCGNQWYCSRDCQVEAWDDHSELCSGG